MGKHYLLNLFDCDAILLDDEYFLRRLLKEAAEASGATVLTVSSHKFQPQGVTVLCLLSESHISIHTWPEESKAAADIFTCGSCDPSIGCDILKSKLISANSKLIYIER
jgi:S-adenosylmethionine decarboxylase